MNSTVFLTVISGVFTFVVAVVPRGRRGVFRGARLSRAWPLLLSLVLHVALVIVMRSLICDSEEIELEEYGITKELQRYFLPTDDQEGQDKR